MTPNDDPIVRLLTRLPALAPDTRRAARTLERCHRALGHKQVAQHRSKLIRRRMEGIAAGAFALFYTAAMVADLIRWR